MKFPLYLSILILCLINQTTNALYLQANNSSDEKSQDPTLGLIHPTIIGATVDKNCSQKECIVTLNTRSASYQFKAGLSAKTFNIRRVGEFNIRKDFSYDVLNLDQENDYVTFARQRDESKIHFNEVYGTGQNQAMLTNKKFHKCGMEVARASEKYIYNNVTIKHIRYHEIFKCDTPLAKGARSVAFEGKPEAVEEDPEESLAIPFAGDLKDDKGEKSPAVSFKYSAVTVLTKDESLSTMMIIDESGAFSSRPIDKTVNVSTRTWAFDPATFSDVFLLDTSSEKHKWNHNVTEVMEKEIGKEGLKIMREHFDLAFIESITLFKEALCFSRGVKSWVQPSVRCLNNGKLLEKELPDVLNEKMKVDRGLKYNSVFAMEVVELDNSTLYHLVLHDEKADETGKKLVPPKYWFCKNDKQNNNDCKEIEVHRIPIDIARIHTKKCDYLVTFYPFMYQVNRVNQSIDEPGEAVFAPWMTFDANAVMAQNDKLYFFLSGNILLTYNFKPDKCNFLDIDPLSKHNFLSSELLRLFGETYVIKGGGQVGTDFKDHKFKAGPPYYTGFTERLDGKWSPPLDYVPPKIDTYTRLNINPFNKTRPATGDGSSKWTFIVLMLVVLLLLVCILYYLYFSKSGQEYEVTALKKLTVSKEKQVVVGGPAANAQPAPKDSLQKRDSKIKSNISPGGKSAKSSPKVALQSVVSKKLPTISSGHKNTLRQSSSSSPGSKLKSKKTKTKTKSKSPGSNSIRNMTPGKSSSSSIKPTLSARSKLNN